MPNPSRKIDVEIRLACIPEQANQEEMLWFRKMASGRWLKGTGFKERDCRPTIEPTPAKRH